MPNAPDSTITVADVLFCLPAIEAKAGRYTRLQRKAIRHNDGGDLSCPLCALAHSVGLCWESGVAVRYAAEALGIPYDDVALEIARAADDPTHPLRPELEAYLSW